MTAARQKTALIVLILSSMLAGCMQSSGNAGVPTPPPPVPVSAETIERIRQLAPDAVIGRVIEVLPEVRMAAVADAPVQDFGAGDRLTFLGGEPEPVGSGLVVAIVRDTLHVRYDEPPAGRRAPAVGDVVLRFRTPATRPAR